MKKIEFPAGFVWGTASASYQVEGSRCEDGRAESIWDRFDSVPGHINNGDTGEIACDHYRRYREDVALMQNMGMKAYRFSVAWPRVCPDAAGQVNESGLQFYSDLVDTLLAAGITPYVTLYHWDLPQSLQDIGGWANPEMPCHFLIYAKAVMSRLGGRVRHWITLNEPYCAAFLGHYEGRHAPGIKDFSTALRVAYYQYVGHGLVVQHFRESHLPGEIGIALNLMGRLPLTVKPEDQAAAKRADGYLNRWFLDPLFLGSYPSDMIEWYRSRNVVIPPMKPEEMRLISQPLDFVGLNYYNDFYVKHDSGVWPLEFSIQNPRFIPLNDRNWPVTEEGFYGMLLRMTQEYGVKSILVTENGTATNDIRAVNGSIEDPQREDYLRRHLFQLHRAIDKGVHVTGYMQWSFCDNFEWGFGYQSRFGLVYVDFETQQRVIKRSGHWYARVVRENAIEWEDS